MARRKSYERNEVARRAMEVFWARGYFATSIDDLVNATGVSRHGLYAEFVDKRGIFVAAVETYVALVVSPAFSPVEARGAGLADIRSYFETQIDLAARAGLPGPGCLIANTMTESGPQDELFGRLVRDHLDRLTAGFRNALAQEMARGSKAERARIGRLAAFLTIAAQGLWSVSRVTDDAAPLRAFVDQLLASVQERIAT